MSAQTPEQADPRRWRILGVSLAAGFMVLLDVTIVNVAVPSIREALDTSAAAVQWVVAGYALTFGLLLVSGGRLGDVYGRRRLMAVGLIGFVAASAAAGLAPSAELLVAARLVQGASAGLLTPQNTGLIQTLFSGRERGVAFGLFGLTVSISSALGPVLGGLIIGAVGPEHGWRWIFLVNVPLGIVLLAAILWLVPGRPEGQSGRVQLDPVGALLLGLAVVLVLLPVVGLESGASPWTLWVLAAPVMLWVFVRWERRVLARGGAPLLDVALLRTVPGYASGVGIGSLYFSGFTGVFLVLSVHLQEEVGLSALQTGLLLAPFAVGSAVSSPLAGRIVDRVGRRLVAIGLTLMVLSLALLVALSGLDDAPRWLVLGVPLLFAGLAGGTVVSPNITLSLAQVPPRMGGAAGGALQTGQRIGTALGVALAMTTYQVLLVRGVAPETALRWGLGTSLLLLAAALAAAVWAWRIESRPDPRPAGEARDEADEDDEDDDTHHRHHAALMREH